MKYKLYIFCPDDETVIDAIINAASDAGAGIIGNYSHCAFIQRGQGNWKSEEGAHPHIGKVGEMTRANEVKIEMECPSDKAKALIEAVKKVHPYDKVVIDFLRLEEV